MSLKNKLAITLCFIIVVGVISSCSNQVNTWGSRQYHMATTRWNVYFNGKESLRKGQEIIEQSHQENFDKLLPVYFENDIQARESASAEMERVVSKAVKAIELHSITAKPKRKKGKRESEKYREFRRKKEYNNLIDECYLLLGKGQFYRREYYSTERTFRYILREFNDMPIYYESAIWYARSLAEQDKYFRALRTVDDVMAEEGFPEELIPMARIAKADMYIRRGLYDNAIEELTFLKNNTKKKDGQTRYYYILAQLYQMQGEIEKAQATYAELVDTHPEYEYSFHAKLSKALLYGEYDLASGDTKVKQELRKLIRDSRNKEYLDQVYYTLARIHENEREFEKAEENYLLSIENSMGDQKQLAKSYLALGDLYFNENKNYNLALENYQQATPLLSEDYPDYEEVKLRLDGLTQLAQNLNTVYEQDSLRKIAQMPTLERENFIKSLMLAERDAVIDKDRKLKKVLKSSIKEIDRPIGEWYFYNPKAVAQGKKEFQKKWGVLNLTDNWRSNPEKFQLSAEERSKLSKDTLSFRTYEDYVADLPLTPELMEASEEKSINALYDAGVIYEDEMDDYIQAKSSFEQVLERNPKSDEKRLRANYHLYMLHSLLDNDIEANRYKNIVLNEYPDSDLAKVLQDPAYYSKMEQRAKDASLLYEKAYTAYSANNFEETKALTQQGMSKYKGTTTYQRFAFLNAMTKAYTESPENFKKALQEVNAVATDRKILATSQELLARLEKGDVPNKNVRDIKRTYTAEDFEKPETINKTVEVPLLSEIEIPGNYTMEVDAKHLVALILPRDLRGDIVKAIEDFNSKKFAGEDLRVRRRNFSLNTDIILVESFKGKEDALNYFGQLIIAQKEFLKRINEVDYTNLIISENNLLKLTTDRDVTPYLDFYAYHYFGEGKPVGEEEVEDQEINNEINTSKVNIENLQPEVGFTEHSRGAHNFVLIVPSKGVDVNYLWTALHNFNKDFRVKKEKLGDKRMLIVQNVGTSGEAMSYLKEVVTVDYIYENLQQVEYRNFVITNENLKLLRSTNAVDNYVQFFKDNYLTK
ncbi:tetratricopeptide repeat protein [Balneicella halophila]|uniref:Tetratricopeptide repeat protein n=2 Tax=Balneicella halophila TaxID=1537566 RepID=A0A7L4UR62_BALHA|nr:tetratricopeptide repeat protein [Balneicella halophila]